MTALAAVLNLDLRLIADENGGVPKGFPEILIGNLSLVDSTSCCGFQVRLNARCTPVPSTHC